MEVYFIVGIVFLSILIWILALIDILKFSFKYKVRNTKWLTLITLLPFIGSILYFLSKNKSEMVTRKFNPNFLKNHD